MLFSKKRSSVETHDFSGGKRERVPGSNSAALALDSPKKSTTTAADKRNFGKGPLLRNSPKKWKSRAEMATMVDVVFFFSLSDVLLSSSKSSSSSFELLLRENQSMQFYPAPPSTLGLRDRNEVSATLHFVSNYFHW